MVGERCDCKVDAELVDCSGLEAVVRWNAKMFHSMNTPLVGSLYSHDSSCHTKVGHIHIAEKDGFSMSKGRRPSYSLDQVLKKLEVGRDGAARIMAGSKPFHGKFNNARDIIMAIDELVGVLAGVQSPSARRQCAAQRQLWRSFALLWITV